MDYKKIINFIGYDMFYGIDDDNMIFENYEKVNLEKDQLEKELYPEE